MAKKFERDDQGGIVDPPIIQSYEQDIVNIAASGDQDRLTLAYEDYRNAQDELVTRLEGLPDKDENGNDVVADARIQESSPTGDEDTSSKAKGKGDSK